MTDGNPAVGRADVTFEVGRDHHHASLLDYLDALIGPIDRPAVRHASGQGLILLNGEAAGPSVTLKRGDVVGLRIEPAALARRADDEVTILHRDGGLVIAAKPPGLPFDSSRSGGDCTTDRVRELCDGARPRPLHRLDRDTSGVAVLALDRETSNRVLDAFRDDEAHVEYLAVVRGALPGDEGVVDVPLGKGQRSSPVLKADPKHGKPLRTAWRVLERLTGYAIVSLTPFQGGRSHQVRAHLLALGNPALCDRAYEEDDRLLLSQLKLHFRPKKGRPERPLLARPALHAARFVWGDLVVEAPLPEDLTVLLKQLRRLRPLA